jgi:Domain of unknown function (DUF3303)
MLLMTTYRVKPFLSDDEVKTLLGVFAEAGAGPGVTAHYVAADNSCGVLISDTDNAADGFRAIQNYTQWVEYETKVMLTVEEAVPLIMEARA